jgi:hypothetical protein
MCEDEWNETLVVLVHIKTLMPQFEVTCYRVVLVSFHKVLPFLPDNLQVSATRKHTRLIRALKSIKWLTLVLRRDKRSALRENVEIIIDCAALKYYNNKNKRKKIILVPYCVILPFGRYFRSFVTA